jgi:hypothetical protein
MRRDGLNPRLLLALLVLVLVAGGIALLTVGGSSSSSGSKAKTLTGSTQVAYKAEAQLSPPSAAPPIALRN